jgi:hypothetical protein
MEDYNEHKVYRNRDGILIYELFTLNGKWHRTSGPAYIEYYRNGNIWYQQYFLNNNHHRVDGPDYTEYNMGREIVYQSYALFHKKISKEDFYTPGFIDLFILEHS